MAGRRSPDWSPRSVHHRRCLQQSNHHHHEHKRRRQADDEDSRLERDEPAAATKVSLGVGGLGRRLSARHLADYLESEAGLGPVWRCRLKTRLTPPGSYPDFQLPLPLPGCGAAASPPPPSPSPDYGRVRPHAFVHFARPDAARDAAEFFRPARPSAHHRRLNGTAALPPPMLFPGSRIEAGDLVAPDTFVAAWSAPDDCGGGRDSALDFVVDPSEARCRALFARDAAFTFPDSGSARGVTLRCDVKIEFPVGDVAEVVAFVADDSLLLRLSAAPLLYYRTAGDDFRDPGVPYHLIHDDDDDPWVRTTDVSPNGAVGRCGAYRVSFSVQFWPTMRLALEYMRRQGVPVVVRRLRLTVRDDDDDQQVEFFGRPARDMFFCVQHAEGLTFPELYLVNVLLHSGVVGRHQLTPEFVGLLRRERDDDVNVAALTELLGEEEGSQVFDDVCWRLKKAQDRAAMNIRSGLLISGRRKAAAAEADCNVEVRRLIITPTRAYCMPPQMERSNRVIRHYRHVADRFLRVTFMDEGKQPLNPGALNLYVAPIARKSTSPPQPPEQKTTVYRRVRAILTEGFCLCGRKYSLLAFSHSQLREKSAWFFADNGATTAASIRAWMGRFFHIRNVAKHAARMGQCFTSSYATVTMRPGEVDEHVEDVVHNGYVFSDGVGKITPDLALEVAERLPLTNSYVPSAFQIRYAGFKGVVAVSPSPGRRSAGAGAGGGGRRLLSLRPSMKKFESTHTVLEVVSWTKPQPAFLNRQIVTLLSTLGVPDAVFWELQQAMVRNLDMILSDSDVAYEVVTRCCPELGSTAALMLGAGFDPATEPHLRAMLLAIKSSQLQGLLNKAKIFVPEGRWLMGCMDELGILEHGQCFIRASTPLLNHRLVTKNGLPAFHSGHRNNAEVVVGTVVMAKNPCLHPGDVRILEAVDVPELHHLVDCLVFPRKGERPHANEASGSDLDGDVFFVTWDQNLVPPGKKSCAPMDYSPAEATQLPREVQQHDTIDFYLESMLNDNLGRISNAHVAHADRSDDGAMDPKCIKLAELAAIAVDSAKTGEVVIMPSHLQAKEYPDFLLKEDDMSYRSEKILGRLFRTITGAYDLDFVSQGTCASNEIPYDTDLEVFGASSFIEDAWQIKCSYEARLNALLNQYSVHTEAELVTGKVWSLTGKRFKDEERLHYAYSQLHKEFRIIFESIRDIGLFSDDKRNLAYEMKASAWYQVTYHPKWTKTMELSEKMPARLSFAWIAIDYLVQIKKRCYEDAEIEEGRLAYVC